MLALVSKKDDISAQRSLLLRADGLGLTTLQAPTARATALAIQ